VHSVRAVQTYLFGLRLLSKISIRAARSGRNMRNGPPGPIFALIASSIGDTGFPRLEHEILAFASHRHGARTSSRLQSGPRSGPERDGIRPAVARRSYLSAYTSRASEIRLRKLLCGSAAREGRSACGR